MELTDIVTALAALAQENRLDVFRLLVRAGPGGMAAGAIAEQLGIAPNTLTFHFDRLRHAGLISVRREGRSMIYAARYERMNGLVAYLTENCCQGAASGCAGSSCVPTSSASKASAPKPSAHKSSAPKPQPNRAKERA